MGEDITERFDVVRIDADGLDLIEDVRTGFKALARLIESASLPNRAFAIAMTELEAAHRAANRAIAEAHRAE